MAIPPHPGRPLLRDCIDESDLANAKTAEHLQLDEQFLTNVCTGAPQSPPT